ncbi:MAG: hypothetical protein GC162_11450 [Planctomycetes bacterium]|nr:hypothetical protein [Planctomycetota bacterium]
MLLAPAVQSHGAVTVTASLTAPTVDGADQAYLPGNIDDAFNIDGDGNTANGNSGANDGSTYIANDRPAMGQTFTTGSNPLGYTLDAVTLRHVLWNVFEANGTFYDIQNGDTFELQIGKLTGSTKSALFTTNAATYSGSAIVGAGTSGTGNYLTFNVASTGLTTLAPNTTYYFEVAPETGAPFFETSGTSADGYAGGNAYRGSANGAINSNYTALTGDRAFHANLTAVSSSSAPASYEPFSIAGGYSAGSLAGQNPTVSGYSGAWAGNDFGTQRPPVVAGSLDYTDPLYLPETGDKVAVPFSNTPGNIDVSNSGRVFRLFDAAHTATDATTSVRYLSFLFQSGNQNTNGGTTYQTLALYDGSTTPDANRNFDAGLVSGAGGGLQYGFGVDNAYTSLGVASNTAVHLFVVRFALSATAGMDSVTVWLDPTLGAGDPTGGVTIGGLNLTWDRLALSDYDENSAAWDEIRWGATFNSVTIAVPAPAALPAGLALMALSGLHRRRK